MHYLFPVDKHWTPWQFITGDTKSKLVNNNDFYQFSSGIILISETIAYVCRWLKDYFADALNVNAHNWISAFKKKVMLYWIAVCGPVR